jgi:hypothetical protein
VGASAVVAACTQVGGERSPNNEISQTAPSGADAVQARSDLQRSPERPIASEPAAAKPVPAVTAAAPSGGTVFIAQTRKAVPVINVLSSGRLEVVDNCLTVLIGGERATAVFPPGVRMERRGGAPSAVVFEGRRLPIGEDTRIPGGGLRASEIPLAAPVPANCPKKLFGLGG